MPQFLFEGRTIDAEDGETVLSALVRHDVSVDYGCKAGACQRCLVCTKPGEAPSVSTKSLDDVLVERGYFLACQAAASSIGEVSLPNEAAYPSYPAELVHREYLSPSVIRVRWKVEGLVARRGQCLRLKAEDGLARSYSIADLDRGVVEFHIRLIPDGAMSGRLLSAQMGDVFAMEGPFGKCTYRHDEKPLLLIGSGTGLAPLWGVAQDALDAGHLAPIFLYHGSATSGGLYFRDKLSALMDRGAVAYVSCADEVTDVRDLQGSPLEHALADHPDLAGYRVYLCGHPALVKTAQKKCFLAGASLKDIHADAFEDQSSP